jgi:hypothetical protein
MSHEPRTGHSCTDSILDTNFNYMRGSCVDLRTRMRIVRQTHLEWMYRRLISYAKFDYNGLLKFQWLWTKNERELHMPSSSFEMWNSKQRPPLRTKGHATSTLFTTVFSEENWKVTSQNMWHCINNLCRWHSPDWKLYKSQWTTYLDIKWRPSVPKKPSARPDKFSWEAAPVACSEASVRGLIRAE